MRNYFNSRNLCCSSKDSEELMIERDFLADWNNDPVYLFISREQREFILSNNLIDRDFDEVITLWKLLRD